MDPMINIGEEAPLLKIRDTTGKVHSSAELRGFIVVYYFWSAECDWCERVDRELKGYLDDWKEQVEVLWIASNANETTELIEAAAKARELPPILLDEGQRAANLFGAVTTPHFFVVDGKGKLAYQGAWDDITFRQRTATQVHVPRVVQALRYNMAPEVTQTPPYGCTLVR